MFLQASVILLTGGVCLSACWDTHLPGIHPPGADTPQEQTPPLGADTPQSRPPPPPQKQTPAYGQRAAGTHPTGMHSCLIFFFAFPM